MTKEQFTKELREIVSKKLGRESVNVANVSINQVIQTYVKMGLKSPDLILDHIKDIKNAKSVGELQHNIVTNAQSGTRDYFKTPITALDDLDF